MSQQNNPAIGQQQAAQEEQKTEHIFCCEEFFLYGNHSTGTECPKSKIDSPGGDKQFVPDEEYYYNEEDNIGLGPQADSDDPDAEPEDVNFNPENFNPDKEMQKRMEIFERFKDCECCRGNIQGCKGKTCQILGSCWCYCDYIENLPRNK